MSKKPKKKRFIVNEGQTIDQVLEQMKKEGYLPVRKIEEPIFKEETEDGAVQIIPHGKKTIFEGKLS